MAKINTVGYTDGPDSGYAADSIRQDLHEIESKSPEVAQAIFDSISKAVAGGAPVAFAGGHCFERKGWLSIDELGGERNYGSYRSERDDVLLQLTVRVSWSEAEAVISALTEEKRAEAELKAEARRMELDLMIARLQAEREGLGA